MEILLAAKVVENSRARRIFGLWDFTSQKKERKFLQGFSGCADFVALLVRLEGK
jgi:hypothetical protein